MQHDHLAVAQVGRNVRRDFGMSRRGRHDHEQARLGDRFADVGLDAVHEAAAVANRALAEQWCEVELRMHDFLVAAADNVLATLKSQQNDVWYYRFDWDEEPAPFNDIYGAAHAFDFQLAADGDCRIEISLPFRAMAAGA